MSAINRGWVNSVRPEKPFDHLNRVLFRDRIGVILFLSTLVFVSIYWRIGVFITDSFAIANTLANVADGHLYIDHIVYGPDSGATQGTVIHNGRLYGRNYGLVFAALPFLWTFEAINLVADLRIALVALWSLGVLALAMHLGHIVDRPQQFTIGGSILAAWVFVTNVLLATPLDPRWIPLMALQTSTMVWSGLLVVIVYRLVAHLYNPRTGLFAGAAVLLATPVGFWATIPKRHVLISLLAMITVYTFYRSRSAEPTAALRFRAVAYASVALSAWVFPLEAFLLFIALAPVDLLTARSNSPRRLAWIGGTFAVCLLPFLVTNVLITGNPLRFPSLLPPYTGEEQILNRGTGGEITGGTAGSGSGSSGGVNQSASLVSVSLFVAFIVSTVDIVITQAIRFWTWFIEPGLTIFIDDPTHVYHVFIRSGYIDNTAAGDQHQAISLSLLEVAPLLASLVAVPIEAVRSVRILDKVSTWVESPLGKTDLLVGSYVVFIVIVYLPRALIHAQVTVRYLLPTLPGLVYLVIRLPSVRHAIDTTPRLLGFAYVGTVFIAGQLLVIILLGIDPSLGEAVQLNALLGLAVALPLGTWSVIATATGHRAPRGGSILLGMAAGVTTVFLLLSGIDYFSYAGDFAIPVVQRLSQALSLVN